jgi:hypothetical protein
MAEESHGQADQQGQESQPEQAPQDKERPEAPTEVGTIASTEVRTIAPARVQILGYLDHSPVGDPVSVVVHQTHF